MSGSLLASLGRCLDAVRVNSMEWKCPKTKKERVSHAPNSGISTCPRTSVSNTPRWARVETLSVGIVLISNWDSSFQLRKWMIYGFMRLFGWLFLNFARLRFEEAQKRPRGRVCREDCCRGKACGERLFFEISERTDGLAARVSRPYRILREKCRRRNSLG